MKKPELLMPASCLEVLKVAVLYGADAVYIGGEEFSLRAKAINFSLNDMKEAIEFAHKHKSKVYITANIIAHNKDLKEVENYFLKLKDMKPDALIISDPGVFSIARKICPEIEIHISTQANNANYETFNFWFQQGAKRVVAARELSYIELKEIKKQIGLGEIEVFVHGAMCISYSGRCLLSNFLTGRDANRGECTHPCRWKYAVVEENRPNEYFPVIENDKGSYIFNSKDLCLIEQIPELFDANIDSLKVEGRMKNALYVATVCKTYRDAIDSFNKDQKSYHNNIVIYKENLSKCTNRQYTTGFFINKPEAIDHNYEENSYCNSYTFLGIVNFDGDKPFVYQKNKFCINEEIEIMSPSCENRIAIVKKITDSNNNNIIEASQGGVKLFIELDVRLNEYDILLKKNKKEEV